MKKLLFAVILVLSSSSAFGWLKVCNKTSRAFYTSAAYTKKVCTFYGGLGKGCYEEGLQNESAGWWQIPPGRCATVFGGELYGDVYIRAERNGRSILNGSRRRKFKICGDRVNAFTFQGRSWTGTQIQPMLNTGGYYHHSALSCGRVFNTRGNRKDTMIYNQIELRDGVRNFTYSIH